MAKRRSRLSALGFWVGVGITAATIAQELRKPDEERDWHGDLYGIPYDYRMPSVQKVKATYWNPADDRVLMPKMFGWGWDVNVGRVVRLASESLSGALSGSEFSDGGWTDGSWTDGGAGRTPEARKEADRGPVGTP